MKSVILTSLLLLSLFCGLASTVRKGGDVIVRRKRNGDYYVYNFAIFHEQKGTKTYAMPRGLNKNLKYDREDVILNIPILKELAKPGKIVLAQISRNKYNFYKYSPAKILREISNDKYLLQPVCKDKAPPAGVQDDFEHVRLPNAAFKASSVYRDEKYKDEYKAHNGRLYTDVPWCAGESDKRSPWLQVDLQKQFYICSVTTMPYVGSKEYVTEFTLSVSKDEKNWIEVMEKASPKIFKRGVSDRPVTHLVNLVDTPYRYIRFHSVAYEKYPCLSVEVNGFGEVLRHPPYFKLKELRLSGTVCNLQNKCAEKPNAVCNVEGQVPGTYTCKCKSGFRGPLVFNPYEKYARCTDIDECKSDACGSSASSCTNVPGSYRCNCKQGFRHETKDQTKCRDIDECSSLKSPCSPHARCTNTPGSFDCTCKDGYQGNGYECTDIDECNLSDGSTKCKSYYSDCTNSPGSYTCTCQAGFTGDGDVCTDINECEGELNPCKKMNGKCVNNIGSYMCHCSKGQKLKDGKCEDIDECESSDLNDCNQHAQCINKPGSYSCECKEGFKGSGYDAFGCLDIDECSEKKKCGVHSHCKNTEGSFVCTCNHGYASPSGRNCSDIDECKTGKAQCHYLAVCNNVPGSFVCSCPAGFTGKGDAGDGCTAMTWCKWKGDAMCKKEFRHCDSKLRKCTDCRSGYEEKNGLCQDVNECETNPCGPGAACVNTPGSFKCHCQKGYLSNSKTHKCEDIDECSSTKSPCHVDATCKNTPGSYTCKCKKGFDGDGFFCADINECYIGDYECPGNSVCSNAIGSYKCTCKRGYHRSGNKCKTKKPTPATKISSLLDLSFLWNSGSPMKALTPWNLLFLSVILVFIKSFF